LLQELRGSLSQRDKAAAVAEFAHSGACNVLLMDDVGAVGLDLSFVQHVFLMEPLVDTALQSQIVSRAHRMGATRPVHVEILVMQARCPTATSSGPAGMLRALQGARPKRTQMEQCDAMCGARGAQQSQTPACRELRRVRS
jgi:ERCC4-related helicase